MHAILFLVIHPAFHPSQVTRVRISTNPLTLCPFDPLRLKTDAFEHFNARSFPTRKREPRAPIKEEPGAAMHGQSSAMNHGAIFGSPAFPCSTSAEGGGAQHEVRDLYRMRMSQPPQNPPLEYKRGSFEAERRCASTPPTLEALQERQVHLGQEALMDLSTAPLLFAMSNIIAFIAPTQDGGSSDVSHRKSLEAAAKILQDYREEKIQSLSAMETDHFRSHKAGRSEGAQMRNAEKRALVLKAVETSDVLISTLMRGLVGRFSTQ